MQGLCQQDTVELAIEEYDKGMSFGSAALTIVKTL